MLIPLPEMLADAERGEYAVIGPDFPSLAVVRYLIEAAEEFQAPLLLSYSTSLKVGRDLHSYRRFIEAVRDEAASSSASLGLHLDHANCMEDIQEAIDLGFTSVMIDASQSPLEENIALTREVVRRAHAAGVAVESEIGHVATAVRYFSKTDLEDRVGVLTEPEDAVEFVAQTGVDSLAIAIGTVHGVYAGEPHLDYERLSAIHSCVPVPLVLHGASGTGAENLRKAVSLGIRKINVFSDLMRVIQQELSVTLENSSSGPNDLAMAQQRAVRQIMSEYLTLSGSMGTSARVSALSPSERAYALFKQGGTCAEAVYLAMAEVDGISSDAVQRVCSMFGGGLCKSGGVCGTLMGALAVIGASGASVSPNHKLPRQAARSKGLECIQWFDQRFGSQSCRDLLQVDLLDPAQAERYQTDGLGERVCRPILMDTVRWLLEHREA